MDDLDELFGGLCTRIIAGCGRVHDVIADVVLNYFRNESVESAPTCGDLLQNRCALRLHFHGAFNCFQLAADSPDSGQQDLERIGRMSLKVADPLKRSWERGVYLGANSTNPQAVKRNRPDSTS